MRSYLLILLVFCSFSYHNMEACTIISMAQEEQVLVGNNENWYIPYTQYRILPQTKTAYSRIFFSYNDDWAQGGMNEKGLFFDWVLKDEPSKNWSNDPKKKNYPGNLSEKVLAECTTVEEALAYYQEYNDPIFEISFLVLVDSSGATATVSWEKNHLEITRCQGFCVGGFKAENVKNHQQKMGNTLNKQGLIELLKFAHQRGNYPTLYSNIYDLKNGLIYLYYYHNFKEEVCINLAEASEKGAHTVQLKTLFETEIPKDQFKKLRNRYLREELKTIPIKGWIALLLISITSLGFPILALRYGLKRWRER